MRSGLDPDFISQDCDFVLSIDVDELLRAEDLPNDLVFFEVVEKDGWVPALFGGILFDALVLFAREFLLQVCRENES